MSKQRLTVTVDKDLVEAAHRAVAAGQASSLSGWVNVALAERAAKERRRRALRALIADYEARFGEITPEEIAAQRRVDRLDAIFVPGARGSKRKTKRRRSAA